MKNDKTTKRFRPSKKWYLPIGVILGLMLLALIYSVVRYPMVNNSPGAILLDLCLALGLLFYILFPAFGMFVSIDDRTLVRTDYFILKKQISINDISDIDYVPTFVAGKTNRTLTIIARENETVKKITMSCPAFTERTLVEVINALKKSKPNIHVSTDAEVLLRKFAG
jgi:hypothetical protein